jgi:hypothetical protein
VKRRGTLSHSSRFIVDAIARSRSCAAFVPARPFAALLVEVGEVFW